VTAAFPDGRNPMSDLVFGVILGIILIGVLYLLRWRHLP
jgi:uncharacterized membrane protein